MKSIYAAFALSLVVILGACGVNVTAGTVVDKTYEEAYTTQEEIMEESCEWDTDTKMVNGKSKTTQEWECEDVGTGEYEDVEHPAVYKVTLEDKDRNDETHEVDKETYDSVEVGDFLDLEAK